MPMKGIEKQFGMVVRKRRLELSLSQEGLAEMADVHRTYISSIERGKTVVSLNVANQIARALRTSLSHMMREVEKQ